MFAATGARGARAQVLFLGLALSATVGRAEPPVVQFDLPGELVARDVIDATVPSASRLVEVTVPVSVRVARGKVSDVREVTIEIDGAPAEIAVHDFAPQTTLGSELAEDIKVTTTTEHSKTFNASLGGQSPIPLGGVTAQVTPTLTSTNNNATKETATTSRYAPKKPVVVSGTLNAGRGAFFQMRPSSQTTLEGQHALSIVFRVPDDWTGGPLEVRCWARGERQILWFDQPQVWGSTRRAVTVAAEPPCPPRSFAKRHVVAKQPTTDPGENWVPDIQVSHQRAKHEGELAASTPAEADK
ncbi:hypothetical protein [Aeoliella mucimassa]|uniref:Uncharacterized protein n=1 Tax=Aeoliella mucimassa TaxID=2527972 RepID=A0A518AWH4_9BACT|nr:hypothetical protein [Aeoliella mucimassa]QDU59068.1 hypothetical protein Pan181_53090 [Aeoliella mucimassa]